MWFVHWIGYRTGEPHRETFYAERFAEQYAAALRGNGLAGVRVEKGPTFGPAAGIVLAASWRAVEA